MVYLEMAEALDGGALNLENLVTRRNGVSSPAALREMIQEAFYGATEEDVSYFYISTHGLWSPGEPTQSMTLLLSDGIREGGITAGQLKELFDEVPGTKVLIVDACHAGAMIGKGIRSGLEHVFQGEEYKILCSCGGAEESWFWSGKGREDGEIAGEGYFSGALSSGISIRSGYAADLNGDGLITLSEIRAYLRDQHGASTVQTYPEEDDFVFFSYDPEGAKGRLTGDVGHIFFEDSVLNSQRQEISFSFTVYHTVRLAYQLVYHRGGRWDFERARLWYDTGEGFGGIGDTAGYLSPGLKSRTLSLDAESLRGYGYVLFQMLGVSDDRLSVISSHVICVPPVSGDPKLSVHTSSSFSPGTGQEMTAEIDHIFPMELTVTVVSESGETVCRLMSHASTRPQQMQPRATTVTWNGRRQNQEIAEKGTYRFMVRGYVGDTVYEAESEPFELQ